jgi:hypothetical protein
MATTAAIEKVVRKVLDEELSETNEATLKAIQRVSRLLTEKVIPNLPEDADQENPDTGEETPVPGNEQSRSMRGAATRPGSGEAENPEIPEEDEAEPPTQNVPEPVTEAFKQLYSNLSAEQAKALAAMFTAISRDPSSEEA